MTTPIFDNPDHATLLRDSLVVQPDTDALHASINAILRNRPSVAQCDRVIRHLREDHFDYESNTASDACLALEAYRETLYLEIN